MSDTTALTVATRAQWPWLLMAIIGTGALAFVAAARGEAINAWWHVVAAVCVYPVAYRYYSLFLASRVMQREPARPTRAHRLNAGLDYVPTNKNVLFGHHFAAIAGAGPLVGPIPFLNMPRCSARPWPRAGFSLR
jgi:hypothetical protein